AIFSLPSNLLDVTPLYFFWSAHEAVIFFFVLSGFVLTLPFLKKKIHYGNYIVKRILRIYIPYLIAISFTFVLYFLFSNFDGMENLGAWAKTKWREDPSLIEFLNHLLLIGNFETSNYNPVIWTLVQEMRISFIFPLIVYLVVKFKAKHVMLLGMILSIVACLNVIFEFQDSMGFHTSIFDTLHYIFMFFIGSILAKNKDVLINTFKKLTTKMKWVLLIVAAVLYTYSRGVYILPLL